MSDRLQAHFGAAGAAATVLDAAARSEVASALGAALPDLTVYAASPCAAPGGVVVAARESEQRRILVCGDASAYEGKQIQVDETTVTVCDASEANMNALRGQVAHLRSKLTGTTPSVGLGDRLGLATPGHIAADDGSGFILVLPQQSIREMVRTARTAQQVMDDACFGAFEVGYDAGFGSDADHLKTFEDVDVTAEAGFTFFTIDPSEFVDDTVADASDAELSERFEKLVADEVPGAAGWRQKYVGKSFTAGNVTVEFDEPTLLRAAVKYGRAVAHAVTLAEYIAKKADLYELELSVDETAVPTSVAEHLFIADELAGRGVKLISLAPRFVGEFEKGIDYKGDIDAFEASLRDHTEIARHYGPYKLSVHSGSDKFAVYPIVARVTQGLFHLKTAGTSYLEALRVVARHDVSMFREIIGFCRGRFETDRATYHISSSLGNVPEAKDLPDADLERVYLDEDDGRQILHVTFGSVLTVEENGKPKYRGRLMSLLNREAATYVEVLKKHIGRHIQGLRGVGG